MEELDLRELFMKFWKRKVQMILIILIFVLFGIVKSYFFTEPDYEGSTTLLLTQSSADVENGKISSADIALNSSLLPTYGEIVHTENVLLEVVKNINSPDITIDDIRDNITVQAVENTAVLKITVTNNNPKNAAVIANEVAKVFCEKVAEIYNISNTYVMDRAEPTNEPYNIDHLKDIMVFTVIGIVVALMFVVVESMLTKTSKKGE